MMTEQVLTEEKSDLELRFPDAVTPDTRKGTLSQSAPTYNALTPGYLPGIFLPQRALFMPLHTKCCPSNILIPAIS